MAKSKAELLSDHDAYSRYVGRAAEARDRGEWIRALNEAEASWKHVEGALQFERKHLQNDPDFLDAIEIVLHLSPLVFDLDRLDRLDRLLEERRRLLKRCDPKSSGG